MFCKDCGQEINDRAEICPKCGIRQSPPPGALTITGGRSKIVAALLAFFLGGIGIHKFYLGQGGMGVLYLLFFWTFIPSIIAFFEFIFLLVMSQQEFDAKFNT